MLSNIKNWVNKLEFWLAIIMGLTLSLGLAPVTYAVYFERVGSPHSSLTHTGPLWATSFGYQLWWANIALICAFPAVTLILVATHHEVKRSNLFYLWFILPLVQFIWGLVNMVIVYGLLE